MDKMDKKKESERRPADPVGGRAGRSGDRLSVRRLPAVAARQPVRAGVSVLQNEADAAAGGGTGALAAVLAAAARLRAAVPARLRAALAVGRPKTARRGARGALRGLFGGAGADRVALLGRGRLLSRRCSRSSRCRGLRICSRARQQPSSPGGCSAAGWRSPTSRCGRCRCLRFPFSGRNCCWPSSLRWRRA